ncbi:hypothetical protein, conserved [Trypanosoma cruzi]|uniref:Uncharacterized protein n=2 Tax=Trypanosoma cruzi TaxID=5693 RepID=Q4DQ56_TRYCC|nr:hypothetical protein, conserved [Trypanosoma cruzi]EAN94668.1 hypothetical protein, conserved [Trypanosoma cruzi]|eukprot:XP_816519.1 hypothetical protein [Trypanosoma cruzi strain CL Brener]
MKISSMPYLFYFILFIYLYKKGGRTGKRSKIGERQFMQRQARLPHGVNDASDVSRMDPWKDDRCRDFIALNTIQRLRSYHADTLLPVEPINIPRAKNLLLLPKAGPDARTCDTEEGCAIDTARILFFGPKSFTSLKSPGCMTAFPHGGGNSGSRSSFSHSEEVRKSSSAKRFSQTPSMPLNCSPSVDSWQQQGELNTTTGEGGGTLDNGGIKSQGTHQEAFDAGATPLRRSMSDAVTTPAPRPPEPITGVVTTCEEGNEHINEGRNACQTVSGVVKFSCAIVDAIVAYYQSLLSRGVVLDRFNSKDLAFSWWVVGRNMDVAALHHYTGPMRRDSLVILVRHFYYELLVEQRPKKSLLSGPVFVQSQGQNEERNEAATASPKPEEETVWTDSHDQSEDAQLPQTTGNDATITAAGEKGDGAKKRPRSRLDPTRTSPLPVSNRLCRRRRLEEGTNGEKPSEAEKSTGAPKAIGASTVTSNRTASASKQAQHSKGQSIVQTPVAKKVTVPTAQIEPTTPKTPTAASSSSVATALESTAQEKSHVAATHAGEDTPPVERPHRSSRSANIEDVWRPIRLTRRRLPPSENSTDFTEATSTIAERGSASVSFLNLIVERINKRMANDSNYADLLTAFPTRNSEVGCHNVLSNTGNDNAKILHGMHPALMQLFRYYHTSAPDLFVPRTGLYMGEEAGTTEEEKTNMAERAAKNKIASIFEENGENGEEQQISVTKREPSTAQSHDMITASETLVKVEHINEDAISSEPNGLRDESHVDAEAKAPLMQLPFSFSELTYAQRCLLTWEASLLLNPRPTLPVKRGSQATSGATKCQVKPSIAKQRHYYDYWGNP